MPPAPQFYFDAHHLDMSNEQLWRGSQALHLTPKAVWVLHMLLAHAGQMVTKEQLFQAVWPDTTVSDGVLTNCIGELRQALEDAAQTPHFIQTVHRRGYRFLAPISEGGPPAPGEADPLLPWPHRGSLGAPAAIATGPMVGRETELASLHRWLEQALQGSRRVVFVSGEAGMGKTTVLEAFLASVGGGAPVWVAWGQCQTHYGAGEAYLPVLDAMGRLCRAMGRAPLQAVLEQYAPSWLIQLPALRSAAQGEGLAAPMVGASQERMLCELAEALEALTAEQLLVLVLEDLQWSDHATLDLLAWLARRREPARLLVVGTYRPVEVIVHGHPLRAVVQEQRHPFDVARALLDAAVLHQCCREASVVQARAEVNRPYLLALFAAAHATMGQRAAALTVVSEALALGERTDMRNCEVELRRLQGKFLLRQAAGRAASPNRAARASTWAGAETAAVAAAKSCFHQALAIARPQQAKAWELRAAMSLVRLLRQQGKRDEAREVLAPVYSWFTEGFDTADLQEANALLEELR